MEIYPSISARIAVWTQSAGVPPMAHASCTGAGNTARRLYICARMW